MAPNQGVAQLEAQGRVLQAPFRAGIRLDAYQSTTPASQGPRLPRVNLLIADDVGLGKTVEAGLVARELLLRRRIDLIVISASGIITKAPSRSIGATPPA